MTAAAGNSISEPLKKKKGKTKLNGKRRTGLLACSPKGKTGSQQASPAEMRACLL
jgi:hypothetical protein